MRYTVVVKELKSSSSRYSRERYNNVSKRIIKFLLKHNYCFMKGIANHYVNMDSAKNYVEIFAKSTFEEAGAGYSRDEKLYKKLRKLSRKRYKR